MGGASSHFADTDWDKNDGGLREASDTLDGSKPTTSHTILTLKKQNVVNQRDFEIRNDMEELLYQSRGIEGTTKCFDLLDAQGQKLFCIQTDKARVQWIIYSYTPNWESQKEKSPDSGLYRKAQIDIAWNKYHGSVRLFGPGTNSAGGGDGGDGGEEAAAAAEEEVLAEEPVLVCEEIRSITAQFQSFIPSKTLLDTAIHPPLAGWWVWEHTKRRHQLKMHLAKGNDIALHCIVAITCNMVNVEKQADTVQ